MKRATIATHLRHIKAAHAWAVKMKILARVPEIEMPPKAKGAQVKPSTLQFRMGRASIETTLKYYVALDASDVADER